MHTHAKIIMLAAAAVLAATCAHAAEERREQGPHQHGHGTFELAIEKTTVSIELRVPGSDIVGFEHAAKTDKDKAAIEAAKKTLSDPIALFGLPAAAACKLQDADVHLHGGGAEGDAHDHDHDKQAGAKTEDKHDHADGHATFHAKYTLACTKPSAITSLTFAFFKSFPASQELEIVAVSETSQVKAEATPTAPDVSLAKLW